MCHFFSNRIESDIKDTGKIILPQMVVWNFLTGEEEINKDLEYYIIEKKRKNSNKSEILYSSLHVQNNRNDQHRPK